MTHKEFIIQKVINQIKEDLDTGYEEAVEELLTFCPIENLVNYLPEDLGPDYDSAGFTEDDRIINGQYKTK